MNLSELKATGMAIRLPGQKSSKKRANPEENLHKAVIQLANAMCITHPLLQYLFHPANGGGRSKAEGGILKACGVKRGVPDLLLPLPSPFFSGLAIELKSNEGRLSEEQRQWLSVFESNGYVVGVARSVEDFQYLVKAFFGKGDHRTHTGYAEIFGHKTN